MNALSFDLNGEKEVGAPSGAPTSPDSTPAPDSAPSSDGTPTSLDGTSAPDSASTAPDALDADAAFARLEELVALLPEIQTRDQQLLRAREARELLELDRRAHLLINEIAGYERIFNQALLDAKVASDVGDPEAEGHNLALVRMYNELKYTRLATKERAENDLREALKRSDLSLNDPLVELALSDEDYQALENNIHAYQQEYQQVYEFCLSVDSSC
jgi:hypothetical protein